MVVKPSASSVAVYGSMSRSRVSGMRELGGGIDYFKGMAAARAFSNMAAASAQSVRQAARSASGNASRALASRIPARSVSSCQCFSVCAMNAFAWG